MNHHMFSHSLPIVEIHNTGHALQNKTNLTWYVRVNWQCFAKNHQNNGRNTGAQNWPKLFGRCSWSKTRSRARRSFRSWGKNVPRVVQFWHKLVKVIHSYNASKPMTSNYKPVSVPPLFAKIREHLMLWIITKYKFLYSYHFSFRYGHSPDLALICLVDIISNAFEFWGTL